MTRPRLLPTLVLAAGLLAVTNGSSAQPPSGRPGPGFGPAPGQPNPGGRAGQPGREAPLPLVPKSAGAFVTLKVSDLLTHPDLKPVLADLVKQPDALAGITEVTGVSPLEIDRVTLFWPQLSPFGGADPIVVISTREPFNEARVLKALQATPVFDGDFRRGRGRKAAEGAIPAQNGDANSAPEPAAKLPPQKIAPNEPVEPPLPKSADPKPVPPPPPKPQDDLCGGSSEEDAPSDPLFYAIERGTFAALFLIDDRTLVFLPGGPDGEVARVALLAATLKKDATGPLAGAIAAAGKHTFAAGMTVAPLAREFDRGRAFPRELVPYTALFAARTAVVTGDLDKSLRLSLALGFEDATAAKRAAPVLEEGIATVTGKIGAFIDELKDRQRPVDKAVAPVVTAFADGLKKVAVKVDGSAVTATSEIEVGPATAKALGELIQAVQSRKKAELRTNNLKQIGLALHSYHDANGKFPTNVYGPKGEPLLSWRVHLLPYLEEAALYQQFKMDEPWDGPNNKALIEKMPRVFLAPEREHAKGKTFYQGFRAPDPQTKQQPLKGVSGRPWLIDGDKNGITFASITDGTSLTLAVIEAREGVIWSKPDDLPFGGAVPPLGEKGSDRTPALWFDGHASLFPTDLKPLEFWPYTTINGGEVTPVVDAERRFERTRPAAPALEGKRSDRMAVPPPAADTVTDWVKQRDLEARTQKLRVLVAELHMQVAAADLKLRAEEKQAEQAAAVAEATTAALAAGSATAEEVARANVRADEAKKAAQIRRDELEKARERLKVTQSALDEELRAGRTEK